MNGFIDLQVNGYAGVDFNAGQLSEEQVETACQRLNDDGNVRVLATIITAPLDEMIERISRLANWIENNPAIAAMIGGIHVEGPFISRHDGYVGAHPVASVIEASQPSARRLVEAGQGHVRLVTLAPEMDDEGKVTQWLSRSGHVVAAGHTNATLDQLRCAIDSGLQLFTHLGNGCPGELPRHDNIIQRVLSLADRMAVSLIADGHHVPTFALGNYLDRIPEENIIIVTDAISAAGLGPGKFELAGQTVEVDENGAAWATGRKHFAGCATTMPEMVRLLRKEIGASEAQIRTWTSTNPLRFLGR